MFVYKILLYINCIFNVNLTSCLIEVVNIYLFTAFFFIQHTLVLHTNLTFYREMPFIWGLVSFLVFSMPGFKIELETTYEILVFKPNNYWISSEAFASSITYPMCHRTAHKSSYLETSPFTCSLVSSIVCQTAGRSSHNGLFRGLCNLIHWNYWTVLMSP